jgi:hypothetical protein
MARGRRRALVLFLVWHGAPAMALAQPSPVPALPPALSPGPQGLPAEEAPVLAVPYEQIVTVEIPGATRVLSVNPDIIQALLRAPGVIELQALAFGRTFIHVWTPSGRITRPVQVVQPPPQRPTFEQEQEAAEELARHLTVEYQNQFRSLRRGPHLGQTDLTTTTQFSHDLITQMESPYGDLRGTMSFQRFNDVNELTAWSASVADGRLGRLKRFGAIVGDTGVGFSDLTIPNTSLRGAQASYYDLDPYNFELFHGRRRLGLNAALSPGSDLAADLYFTGARAQDLERPWTWNLAYATASGEDRVGIQTSQAAEASSWYWPDERVGFGAEVGRNQEAAYGYRLKSAVRGGVFNLDATFRNLSQRYENLLGASAEQGERGLLLEGRQQPLRSVRLRERLDVYQDRLFLNPDEPDQQNLDLELDSDVDLTPGLVWGSRYGRQRLLGRLFPIESTTVRTNLRQRLGRGVPLLANGSVFTEYQFRDFQSVSAPESDFDSHSVTAGLGAPITDVLYWQASQQVGRLKEDRSGAVSHPKETSAGVSYFQRFARAPVSLRSSVNYSVASGLGSPNTFLTDQHRASWDAGIRYDVSRNSHVFFDTRVSRRSSSGVEPEYEVDLETGMRYLLDTGITWDPSVSISGVVFQDLNADGAQQAREPGMLDIAVSADGREAATDHAGRFYVGRVRGRRATVGIMLDTVPGGFVPTTPPQIEIDLRIPPPMPLFFGFVVQAELRVRVAVDANMNGTFDAADAPLEGVRITLSGGPTVRTDRSGWAYFRGISPGRHQVALALADLASGYIPSGELTQEELVHEGQTAEIGYLIKAERSISGRVYVDMDRNGRFDAEPVLPGLPVCLDDARRADTLEDGRYLFKDVPAGPHRVSLNCGEVLRGYLPLGPAVQAVEMPAGPIRRDDVDFRLGEEAPMMLDITADVLRGRVETPDVMTERIIKQLDAASEASRQRAGREPASAAVQEPPAGLRRETAAVDIVVQVED